MCCVHAADGTSVATIELSEFGLAWTSCVAGMDESDKELKSVLLVLKAFGFERGAALFRFAGVLVGMISSRVEMDTEKKEAFWID